MSAPPPAAVPADSDRRPASVKNQIEVLFAGRMIEKVISFGSLIVMARLFSQTDLALLPSFYIVATGVLIVAGMGAMPVITIELPRLAISDVVRAGTLVRTATSLYAIVCTLGLAALAVFPALVDLGAPAGLSRMESWAMIVGAIVQGGFTLLSQVLAALAQFKALIAAEILLSVFRLVLVIPAYLVYGRTGLLIAFGVSAAAGLAVTLWSSRRVMFATGGGWDHRTFLGLSWPLYVEGYLMFLRRQGDQVIVGGILGAKALAGYYLARRFVNMLRTVADSFDAAVAPALSRLSLKSRAEFAEGWSRYLVLSVSATLPVTLASAVIAPAHLAVVGGRGYQDYAAAASILCLSFAVDLINGAVISRAVFVQFPSWMRLALTTAESAVLLPMLALGAWWAGATGAAVAVVAAGLAGAFLGAAVLSRRIPLHVLDAKVAAVVLQTLVAGLLAMTAMLAAQRLPIPLFEVRQVFAGAIGAVTFALAYANLLSGYGLNTLTTALAGTKLAPAVRTIRRLRFRHDG